MRQTSHVFVLSQNLARLELGNLKLKTALKYLLMVNNAMPTFLATFSKTMAKSSGHTGDTGALLMVTLKVFYTYIYKVYFQSFRQLFE